MTEVKWCRSSLIHLAGTLRNRWVCNSCTGVKCEILLALDDEPEDCLKEGISERLTDGKVQYVRTYQEDGDVDLFL